jgi:hypothetical protein
MKLLSKKALFAAAMISAAPMAANAATVNLDSTDPSNAVTLDLQAGTYKVTPIAGDFDSWNAWGSVSGCDSNGENCSKGWITNFSIETSLETITIRTSDINRYATPTDALANALSATFTILSDEAVKFFIIDHPYGDNIGGVSLDVSAVSAVPVPAAAFLFAPALAGFIGLRRKAKKA